MNELQVNEINKTIDYEEGKIFWEWNKNWTSELWKKLYRQGYRMSEHKSGLTDIHDNTGVKIVHGAIGRVNALKELAKVMR